jgi:hypothetical protein
MRKRNATEVIDEAVGSWIKAPLFDTAYRLPGRGWGEDRIHRTWVTQGERILRKLQRTDARRVAEQRHLLRAPRSLNHDRKIEKPRQHKTTQQCSGQPNTSARGPRTDGPTANDALTFNQNHSSGTAQHSGSIVTCLRTRLLDLSRSARHLVPFCRASGQTQRVWQSRLSRTLFLQWCGAVPQQSQRL